MAKKEVGFKHHPETVEGEVFLSNISLDLEQRINTADLNDFKEDSRSDWESIGWRTKRIGSVAYDIYGKPISRMRPVFVKRDELLKGGINPDTLWER